MHHQSSFAHKKAWTFGMSIPSWSQEDLAALRRDIEELRKAKGLPSAATAQQAWEKVGDGGVFQAFFGKYGGFPP